MSSAATWFFLYYLDIGLFCIYALSVGRMRADIRYCAKKEKELPACKPVLSLINRNTHRKLKSCESFNDFMIRLFTAFCKLILNNLSQEDALTEEDVFLSETRAFNPISASCPFCGAPGKLTEYSQYDRNLVYYEDGQISVKTVSPLRFKCASCNRTHALLPDIIIPYSPYSLRFKLSALIAYFERDTTVVAVCERFGIAVSTLYSWKYLLRSHRKLLQGALAALTTPALAFLTDFLSSANPDQVLKTFFLKYGFSFMQQRKATRTPLSSRCMIPTSSGRKSVST